MDDNTDSSSSKEAQSKWFNKLIQKFTKPHTKESLLDVVNDAVKEKVIDDDAHHMIEGVINVSNMQVRDIMMTRSQMTTIHIGMPQNEYLPILISCAHTRIPVFDSEKEDVIGILHTKDLLQFFMDSQQVQVVSQTIDLRKILRPALFVPESKRLDSLLREFKSKHNHLAIVVDEYGTISGLITIEDILEEIVGNIEDEFDKEAEHITKKGDNEYIIDAITEIEDFNDYFDAKFSDEEVDTIGGLILQHLEHVPQKGEVVTFDKFTFTVLNADNRKINTLRVILNEEYQSSTKE
ncbi:CBS domain-containing protein [Thiotrichales bacterium 19S11-10]|nr:CBS domain-containing protein [Thiotrichales bacterium 19S11-10]MCF6808444.1 CBS domain-containing protein [Thiotrichales bacterium 19S9-11]MCF6812414.1 CBS domain-containing protein [Thiotrichales bacterium 19S9-12]